MGDPLPTSVYLKITSKLLLYQISPIVGLLGAVEVVELRIPPPTTVPPILTDPPIPTPPTTCRAPVAVDILLAVLVIVNIPAYGLLTVPPPPVLMP
jgi:hypothetical protein